MAITVTVGGIHLVNSNSVPTPDGVATAAATTPFSIRPGFTLAVPEPLPIFGGGPPFRPGASLAYSSYDNVSQRIPIHVTATTHEIAVARMQQLKLALASISQTVPALFGVQPTSSSTIMYGEILSGFVRELTEEGTPFEVWEARTEIDAEILFIQKPFFGNLTTGETVISAQSIISGAFTGSPDNVVPFTTGAGDLISEGQPLNLTLAATGGTLVNDADVYLGTIDSVISDATTQSVTTSSATGVRAGAGDTITVAPPLNTKQALNMRLFVINTTNSANAQWRVHAYVSSSNETPFYSSPWQQTAIVANGVFDAGTIPGNLFRDTAIASLYLLLEVRSTSGSVTVTLANFYLVCYYTMCRLAGVTLLSGAASDVLHLRGFVEASGRACLPLPRAEVYAFRAANLAQYGRLDGLPPVYLSGASFLFYAIAAGLPVAGTFTLTARQAPLFKSYRGA